MTKKDGGPAYPYSEYGECGKCGTWVEAKTTHVGMRLRDYFAAAAMQGLMSYHGVSSNLEEWAPERAYEIADAMLAERDK